MAKFICDLCDEGNLLKGNEIATTR
jgi:hypothetical protein